MENLSRNKSTHGLARAFLISVYAQRHLSRLAAPIQDFLARYFLFCFYSVCKYQAKIKIKWRAAASFELFLGVSHTEQESRRQRVVARVMMSFYRKDDMYQR